MLFSVEKRSIVHMGKGYGYLVVQIRQRGATLRVSKDKMDL